MDEPAEWQTNGGIPAIVAHKIDSSSGSGRNGSSDIWRTSSICDSACCHWPDPRRVVVFVAAASGIPWHVAQLSLCKADNNAAKWQTITCRLYVNSGSKVDQGPAKSPEADFSLSYKSNIWRDGSNEIGKTTIYGRCCPWGEGRGGARSQPPHFHISRTFGRRNT